MDWIALRKELELQGVKIGQYTIEWDTNGGNSCYCRGPWGGYSVNSLAMAYKKYFGLSFKDTRDRSFE
jgi:hypothetical protein